MYTPYQEPLKTITPMLHSLGLKIKEIADIVGCEEEVISTIMKNLETSPPKTITPRLFNGDAAVIALHLHHYGCSLDTIVKLLESASFELEEVEVMTVFWRRRIIPHAKNTFKTRPKNASVETRPEKASGLSDHSDSTFETILEDTPILSDQELQLMMELGQIM